MLFWIVIWLVMAVIVASVARGKGLSGFAWFLYGFLLWPVALIHVLVAKPDRNRVEAAQIQTGEMRKCPHCAEMVKPEAKICRYCQRELPAVPVKLRIETGATILVAILLYGSAAAAAEWTISRETSPLDDSKTIFATKMAEAPSYNGAGSEIWPYLVVRCRENETDAYIIWDNYLADDDGDVRVIVRVDSAPAETQAWDNSTDSTSTFHRDPINWIRALVKAKKLFARVTPYNDNSMDALFHLDGIAPIATEIAETCHWTLTP